MFLSLFSNLTEKDKSNAIENLIETSTPSKDFFLMIILSILMATFGLLINSSAIIIGSMLIAPMLYPILSLALGITISDTRLISRSFYTIIKSLAYGIAAATIITAFFSYKDYNITDEILSRTEPSLAYAGVAIIAGMAASFALVKPKLSESLPGIAISVALIPPLAVTGIGIARFDWEIISNSFVLFIINAAGIIFASMIVFSLMNLYIKRTVVEVTIKKEDANLQLEKTGEQQPAQTDNIRLN
ncbi:TIGR00341 family protein [Patescibacteria group bacterium]|nr:TIGR00341 family protein [Patescibacteria group bacterium]